MLVSLPLRNKLLMKIVIAKRIVVTEGQWKGRTGVRG